MIIQRENALEQSVHIHILSARAVPYFALVQAYETWHR
jgi:hypothetical protein